MASPSLSLTIHLLENLIDNLSTHSRHTEPGPSSGYMYCELAGIMRWPAAEREDVPVLLLLLTDWPACTGARLINHGSIDNPHSTQRDRN